jgi:predicted metal-dependent HD superfamily phosphohydrolase
MDAESVQPIGVELDRMKCHACGHAQICDEHEIKLAWNELVHVAPAHGHLLPADRFRECWRALGGRGHARETVLSLRAAYDEPHRSYHTARHIGWCLAALDQPEVRELAKYPYEVEMALWFHDAVYDAHARDNEERSAVMAEQVLRDGGVAGDVAARIASHVRATSGHHASAPDTQLVIDIDLAILGQDVVAYARFEGEIRREYAWVEAGAYAAGRSQVLRRFLEREAIYATALFRSRYEAQARANILAALEKLSEG